jgi:hypothetical protein
MAADTAPARYGIRADRQVATSLLIWTPRRLIAPVHRDRNTNLFA